MWTFELHVILHATTYSFLFSFQPWTNVETVLSSPAITMQQAGFGPRAAVCWLRRRLFIWGQTAWLFGLLQRSSCVTVDL